MFAFAILSACLMIEYTTSFGVKVKGLNEVKLKSLSCVQLCDPMDYSLPGSSVHGIFQARVLEWIAITSLYGIKNSY